MALVLHRLLPFGWQHFTEVRGITQFKDTSQLEQSYVGAYRIHNAKRITL